MGHFVPDSFFETSGQLVQMAKHLNESCRGEGIYSTVACYLEIVPYSAREIWPAIVIDKPSDVSADATMMGKCSEEVEGSRARNKYNSMEKCWGSDGGELLAARS